MIDDRDKVYFGQLDKWLSEKLTEQSWLGVSLSILLLMVICVTLYNMSEILIFFGHEPVMPRQHFGHMLIVYIACFIMLIPTVLNVAKLLKRRSNKIKSRGQPAKKNQGVSQLDSD